MDPHDAADSPIRVEMMKATSGRLVWCIWVVIFGLLGHEGMGSLSGYVNKLKICDQMEATEPAESRSGSLMVWLVQARR
ncbi:unnamed protein product, partial [Linum tenue]